MRDAKRAARALLRAEEAAKKAAAEAKKAQPAPYTGGGIVMSEDIIRRAREHKEALRNRKAAQAQSTRGRVNAMTRKDNRPPKWLWIKRHEDAGYPMVGYY
jgi:hypothetical protein